MTHDRGREALLALEEEAAHRREARALQRTKAHKLAAEGLSIKAISQRLGVSASAVGVWLRASGVRVQRPSTLLPDGHC